ncbi:Hypothetical protein PHPALM_3269 [Phytophthora palmivora]|uniref:Uncharacterized protein n=1 Tax=Phytophthora palmivora TaxID=4796 RepID=A0A2P4YMU8_9STRA|nr:Hypothetical protein PHPALM_3269 [Phytophthora palmivora]
MNKGFPNEGYIVQWSDKECRFCATWVFTATLFEDRSSKEMKRIDTWKDKFTNLTYAEYSHNLHSTYTFSKDAKGFFKAIRKACHVIQDPDPVSLPSIAEFEEILGQEGDAEKTKEGGTDADIKEVLEFY